MRERFDHAQYQRLIDESRQRLSEMEEKGTDALSAWDHSLGKVLSGGVEEVLYLSKLMLNNRINHYGEKLEELGPEVRQLGLLGGFEATQTDEEELLERGLTHDFYMPAEDEHLEDLYDWQQSGDEDVDDQSDW